MRGLHLGQQLIQLINTTHAAAATAPTGLDHHRHANLFGKGHDLCVITDW